MAVLNRARILVSDADRHQVMAALSEFEELPKMWIELSEVKDETRATGIPTEFQSAVEWYLDDLKIVAEDYGWTGDITAEFWEVDMPN